MNTEARRKVLHKRAVISYRSGQAETWVTCLAARRIVGKYENGATAALASDMCRSVDTVENMAWAGWAYVTLRPCFLDVSELRRRLSWSHFSVLWRGWNKYEFSYDEAIGYLRTAAEHGASVSVMRNAIEGEHGEYVPEPRRWPATTRQAKGTMGQVGYKLTIYIDELFDDSPSYGTPVTVIEEHTGATTDSAGGAEVGT